MTVVGFIKSLITVSVGVFLGLLATYMSLERGFSFGAVHAGPWTTWPKMGAMDIDPYSRAVLSRTAEIPLGTAEGISFVARIENAACDYVISGNVPTSRFWTITLVDSDGLLVANDADRFGFTSSGLLRSNEGTFEITIARTARSGNWLPSGPKRNYLAVLRLYDSPLSGASASLDKSSLPSVTQGACS